MATLIRFVKDALLTAKLVLIMVSKVTRTNASYVLMVTT